MTGGGSGIGFEITRQLGKHTSKRACQAETDLNSSSADFSMPIWSTAVQQVCSVSQHASLCCLAGLHGAAVVITGRRPEVLKGAVVALQSEGIQAHGIQVC